MERVARGFLHRLRDAIETKTEDVRTSGQTRLYAHIASWAGTSVLILLLACMIYEYRHSWVVTKAKLRGERASCRRRTEHSKVHALDGAQGGGLGEIRTHTTYVCPMILTYRDQSGRTVERRVHKTFHDRPSDIMLMDCDATISYHPTQHHVNTQPGWQLLRDEVALLLVTLAIVLQLAAFGAWMLSRSKSASLAVGWSSKI